MIREQGIRLPFSYAAGSAGSRSFAALRDERQILGSRCSQCERVLCPAQSHCARCDGAEVQMVHVGPGGTLQSWTEVSPSPARTDTSKPQTFGLVLLDGADTALIHHLVDEAAPWSVGARVRARFGETRTGSVLDIKGFAPEADAATEANAAPEADAASEPSPDPIGSAR